jgi:hypothetical protein
LKTQTAVLETITLKVTLQNVTSQSAELVTRLRYGEIKTLAGSVMQQTDTAVQLVHRQAWPDWA